MSIDELIREVSSIETSSKEMTSRVAAAAQSLSTSNTALTSLVRGNKKGEEAVLAVAAAVSSLRKATAAVHSLTDACDKCIGELS